MSQENRIPPDDTGWGCLRILLVILGVIAVLTVFFWGMTGGGGNEIPGTPGFARAEWIGQIILPLGLLLLIVAVWKWWR